MNDGTVTANLPKDVGLCTGCNARNSKHATKCHSCSAVLPWAAKKVAAAAPTAAQRAALQPTPAPVKVAPASSANFLSDVDWGSTVAAFFLALAVFFGSLIFPIGGFYPYRYFDREENWLKYVSLAALGIVLLAICGRVFLVGSVGAQAVNH